MVLRPLQKPHPPLWYGLGVPENADWPAANDVNVVMLGLRPQIRAIVDRYRGVRAKLGKEAGPLMGLGRHVVVADTDGEALRTARRAYPLWRESFIWLWQRHGTMPRIAPIYPETWDALQALDNGIAGSPATVRDFIARDIGETGVNYFLSWLAFGSMTLEESLRSTELFAREVIPAFPA
jgi:alkanesulfonate monooxygenase SsuD/methylene tetrahydromethanopterin reductase-like flavin-dependent oxidoreductase (luciferase family)